MMDTFKCTHNATSQSTLFPGKYAPVVRADKTSGEGVTENAGGSAAQHSNAGSGLWGYWVLVSDGESVLNEESLRGSVKKIIGNVDEHWLLGSREGSKIGKFMKQKKPQISSVR